MSAVTVMNYPYQASAALIKSRFVKITGNQTVALTALSSDRPIGVGQSDISVAEAAAGKTATVNVIGVAWVEAGAAVAINTRVMADTVGRAITAVTATNIPAGVSLKAAAAAGDLIPVLLTPGMPAL